MAFSTGATETAGQILTASYLNTYVRDNIAWMATDSPACRAYNNAALSVANNTATAVTLNSERFDNAAMHSTSVNTSRLTVPTGGAGKYLMGASIAFAASGAGTNREFWPQLNGTTRIGQVGVPPDAGASANTSPMTVYALSAADYVEFIAFQVSGGALNCTGQPSGGPEFFGFWFRT